MTSFLMTLLFLLLFAAGFVLLVRFARGDSFAPSRRWTEQTWWQSHAPQV